MHDEIDATFRWADYTAETVAWLTQVRQEEIDAHGMWHWRAYEHKAWYAHMALIEHKNATNLIANGDASGAACAALRFGDLLAEMRMKFRHEENALYGLARKENAEQAARATRKQPLETRVAMVAELTDPRNPNRTTLRNAWRIVAGRLKVSTGAVKRDWYLHKKVGQP
jgi:hypothetical protein